MILENEQKSKMKEKAGMIWTTHSGFKQVRLEV